MSQLMEAWQQIKALGDQIWRDHQRYRAEIGVYSKQIDMCNVEIAQLKASHDTAINEATDSYARAFDTAQKNLTARIAQLERELQEAKTSNAVARVLEDGRAVIDTNANTIVAKRDEIARATPEGRRLMLEGGPSAAQFAPERYRDVDRWQRGAPCTWDPWLGNDE